MALARTTVRSGVAQRASVSSSRVVRVAAVQKGESSVQGLQLAAASLALAGLMAGAADAKVILAQPELKKVFQSDGSAPVVKKTGVSPALKAAGFKEPAAKQAPKPQAVSSSTSGGLDPRSVALPGALLLGVGGYFAISKVDAGFADFVYNAAVRDSNDYAGFEPLLKAEGGYVPPGTKKVKAASKKGGVGGFFGKK